MYWEGNSVVASLFGMCRTMGSILSIPMNKLDN